MSEKFEETQYLNQFTEDMLPSKVEMPVIKIEDAVRFEDYHSKYNPILTLKGDIGKIIDSDLFALSSSGTANYNA